MLERRAGSNSLTYLWSWHRQLTELPGDEVIRGEITECQF